MEITSVESAAPAVYGCGALHGNVPQEVLAAGASARHRLLSGVPVAWVHGATEAVDFAAEGNQLNSVLDAEVVCDAAPRPRVLYLKRPRAVQYITPWSDDRVLVASILAGNESDFTQLYTAYSPRIYRFAFKRLSDATEAEDVTQEVFLAVHRSLAAYHGNSSLIIWMLGIAHNLVNRRFRRAKFSLTSLDDYEAERVVYDVSPADQITDARKITRRCAEAMARDLTPLQRRIFRLKYLHQHSTRAIASALGKSEDAVKANLYRIRKVVSAGTDGLEAVLSSS